MKAYNFSLPDQNGKTHKLSDYLGKWIILYFYPKDNTPGCTKEACSFRDAHSEYKKRNVAIIGISKDSVSSHKKFADMFSLSFTLLSDPNHKVIERFGAWGRNTVLINPKGEIVKEYTSVNPITHSSEILKDLKKLQS